ncbi:MAG: efflux RND transporter periplasmic adaptor subunit [Gemmatimonadales bacterium]
MQFESRRIGTDAVLVIAATVATGCHKAQPFAFPPPTVSVVQVAPERVAEPIEFAGQVQAVRRVEVRSPVAGVIVAQPISEGAQVTAGQVLFKIDPTTYAATLRGAQARLAQAQAQLDNATRTVTRLRPLLTEHAVAQKDLDDAESAEAQARAATDDAKASVDRARKDLNDTDVKAEIAGRVGKANLVLGARVTGPADLLTTIDVLDPVRITFRPSTQQVLAWRRDPAATRALLPGGSARVRIVLPDSTEYPVAGKLDFVAPVVDSATGTEEYRAEVPNSQHLLVPGQFVRVRLEGLMRDNAILIPQRAVVQSLGRQSVYTLGRGDTVQSHDVRATAWIGQRWLIDSGLAAGDRVIVDGVQKVRPGAVAKPVPLAADSAAAGGGRGSSPTP